jgi:hypothetical protein
MAVPNIAYAYGTTPPTGGYAAIQQAVNSMFLGVSTTVGSNISSGTRTVTPAAMTNIGVGTAVWINWGLSDQECVSVTATPGGTSFTAVFAQSHTASPTISVTCGLPTLGVPNPWALIPSFTPPSNMFNAFWSQPTLASGDLDTINIFWGTNNGSNVGFGVADDVAQDGTQNMTDVANWTSTQINSTIPVQDASFQWWMVITELGCYLETLSSGTYYACAAGSLITAQPACNKGVGYSTVSVTPSDNLILVAPDISSRLTVGESILIINQSHNSGSGGWNSPPALMTIASVVSNGSYCTITFTANFSNSYDGGALVGAVPIKYAVAGNSLDNATYYLSRYSDGNYSNFPTGGWGSQQGLCDDSAITSVMEYYDGPLHFPTTLFAGELPIRIYVSANPNAPDTNNVTGTIGFVQGAQHFVEAGNSPLDAFGDPSIPAVWKIFQNGNHSVAMGPILNPLNTFLSMQPISDTPFIP